MSRGAATTPVRPSTGRLVAAFAGMVAAAAGWGGAQLVAAVVNPAAAPLDALAAAFIDSTPAWLKEFAIATFGTADKVALGVGIVVCFVGVGALLGLAYQRQRFLGLIAVAALGALGAVVAVGRPGGTGLDWLPAVAGMAITWLALRMLWDRLVGRVLDAPNGPAENMSRRRMLGLVGALGGAATLVGAGARSLGGSSPATAGPEAVNLPNPVRPAPPVPAGAALPVPGLTPYVTPNDAFFRIDTAFLPPRVDPSRWRLRVHGLVEQEVEFSFDDLLAEELIESHVTLTCVSNPVGGGYAGNARWLGWPVRELLARARPLPGADMVLSRSADGWTASTPLEALTDGRDALLAVGMNGAPLPVEHGFPVRMVVPGLYGYVSATKWVVDLEVTTFADRTAYWTDRGWSERGPIKLASRIDVPSPNTVVTAGPVVVAGVAWAQHIGIRGVEVSVDNGPWQTAELADTVGPDTWRQWRYPWMATPGEHRLKVRAIDAAGLIQTEVRQRETPDGATGHHEIRVVCR